MTIDTHVDTRFRDTTLGKFVCGPLKRIAIVVTAPVWIVVGMAVLCSALVLHDFIGAGIYWIATGKALKPILYDA